LIAQWQASGDPAVRFARRHGMTKDVLSYRGVSRAGRLPP
jgi:hypothetical protein